MKKLMLVIILCLFSCISFAKHLHPEKYYQNRFCSEIKCTTEFYLLDKTRVDCLTDKYAIEVEFAPKVYESIGQALYYSVKTGKQPGIVLIIENPELDQKYINRLKVVAEKYNIKVWFISNSG